MWGACGGHVGHMWRQYGGACGGHVGTCRGQSPTGCTRGPQAYVSHMGGQRHATWLQPPDTRAGTMHAKHPKLAQEATRASQPQSGGCLSPTRNLNFACMHRQLLYSGALQCYTVITRSAAHRPPAAYAGMPGASCCLCAHAACHRHIRWIPNQCRRLRVLIAPQVRQKMAACLQCSSWHMRSEASDRSSKTSGPAAWQAAQSAYHLESSFAGC